MHTGSKSLSPNQIVSCFILVHSQGNFSFFADLERQKNDFFTINILNNAFFVIMSYLCKKMQCKIAYFIAEKQWLKNILLHGYTYRDFLNIGKNIEYQSLYILYNAFISTKHSDSSIHRILILFLCFLLQFKFLWLVWQNNNTFVGLKILH